MKLIHGASIKRALRDVSPIRIAVAYVGIDWASYIDTSTLREVVLSPTIGTNPTAILQLVEKLKWENVHFLDNLHAKMYLGAQQAAVGSFNLTANGLSAEGLEEAGFLVSDPGTMVELDALFKTYKSQASLAYPGIDEKQARLAELRAIWDRAVKTGTIRNDSRERDISAYTPAAPDEIYVCCVWGEVEYSDHVVSPSTIQGVIAFDENDKVKPDRWVLCWYADDEGYPDENQKPYWLHIDEVVSEGGVDEQYKKLAIERTGRETLRPPFELTKNTVKALYTVLQSGKFPEFLGNMDRWSLNAMLLRVEKFIAAVKEEASRSSAVSSEVPMSLDALRQLFQSCIRKAMDDAAGMGVIGPRIQTMLQKNHAVTVAKRLVTAGDIQSGLQQLAQKDALHLSFEYIMQEPRFTPLFSKGELESAAWRLEQARRGR